MSARRYQSEKLQAKKRRLKYIYISLIVILCMLVVATVVVVMQMSQFQITRVVVNELAYVDDKQIEQEAVSRLEGKYLGLFPKTNIFVYPKYLIARSITEQYPQVAAVDLDVRGLHTLHVEVIEYQPTALWCDYEVRNMPDQEDIFSQSTVHAVASGTVVVPSADSPIPYVESRQLRNSDCYLLNEDAYIFMQQDKTYDGLVRYVGGLERQDTYVDQTVLNPDVYVSLQKLVALFATKEIIITEVWTKDGEVYTLVADNGAKIHYDPSDDPVAAFDNFLTLLANDVIAVYQLEDIDYIDLRFGNRVFYRMK